MPNKDKKIARIVTKWYKRKSSDKEMIFLLNSLLDKTSLGKEINGKKASVLDIEHYPKKDKINGTRSLGIYNSEKNKVYINFEYYKQNGSIFEVIETYGHEMTHLKQYLKKEYPTIGETELYTEHIESISKKFDIPEVANNPNELNEVTFGCYLSDPMEKGAREGGVKFAVDVFEYLSSNKYINGEAKEKIEKTLEYSKIFMSEYDKENEPSIQKYNDFENILQKKDIHYFSDANFKEDYFVCSTAYARWSKNKTPQDICKNYVHLIGKDGYKFIKDELADEFKKENFPKKEIDELRESLVNVLKRGDVDPKYYDASLVGVLTKNNILDIYKDVFINNIKMVGDIDGNSLLTIAMLDKNYVKDISKIVVENYKDVKIDSRESVESLYNIVVVMLHKGKEELSLDMKKQLKDIQYKIGSKLQDAQKSIGVNQSIKKR